MNLPVPRLTRSCVSWVRRDMTGCGFALVATPACFGGRLFHRLWETRTVLPAPDSRWRRYPRLACYACWLEALLERALPEEALSLKYLDYRREPAGYEDPEVDQLHGDGSYLRTVCTLDGPATIYRVGGAERPVPEGRTLLMTATGRARAVGLPCTLHRRPGAGPQRPLIVCSFEPRAERPPKCVYKEVAAAHRRGGPPRGSRERPLAT
jgi:hypothetical protein